MSHYEVLFYFFKCIKKIYFHCIRTNGRMILQYALQCAYHYFRQCPLWTMWIAHTCGITLKLIFKATFKSSPTCSISNSAFSHAVWMIFTITQKWIMCQNYTFKIYFPLEWTLKQIVKWLAVWRFQKLAMKKKMIILNSIWCSSKPRLFSVGWFAHSHLKESKQNSFYHFPWEMMAPQKGTSLQKLS